MRFILEILIFDISARRIYKGKLIKFFLKQYVNKVVQAQQSKQSKQAEPCSQIIWQYWEQGFENAPDIVKACINSVQKYKGSCKHIILDKENLKEYIEIPEFILELNKKGVIKSAHFSDIVRTYLLEKHGGIWVDATVLLTDFLPSYVLNADFFVFQNDLNKDIEGLNITNYFISAKANNEFISRMRIFLELYWYENNYAINYFFYMHFLTLLTQANDDLKKAFDKVPYYNFIQVQHFQRELLKPYDENYWEHVKQRSFAHKLSYKQKVLNRNNIAVHQTYYEKLINGELE